MDPMFPLYQVSTEGRKGEEQMEMAMAMAMEVLVSLSVLGVCSLCLYLYYVGWVRPERIRDELRRQGIRGPPPLFLTGNLSEMKRLAAEEKARRGKEEGREPIRHDYTSVVFPHFHHWRKTYGPVFLYTMGNVPALHVSQPEMVKDISLCVSLNLGKATYLQKSHEPLFGHSIIKSNGVSWAHQRKIIAPEFFFDKVKGMVDLMVDSALPLVRIWESRVESGEGVVEMKIDDELRSYSADVISRACFGSNYSKGKEIFVKLRALQKAVSKPSILAEMTGLRCLPTKRNREVLKLTKEIHSLILEIVNEGMREGEHCIPEKNLLQTMLQSASQDHVGLGTTDSFIVDNCKTIYFAGHETSAVTATWCLMLLGLHQEWQARVRAEVVEVCGRRLPDAQSIQKMKTLTMVIQETLRLYPPGAFVSREALQSMKFGGIQIPKGTCIFVPVATLHHDPTIWGQDVHEFNPERFAHGVLGACRNPQTYVPFGAGTRTCLGQHFAMVELKVVLSLILLNFSFTLSPNYRHSPALKLIVEPEFGVNLVLKKA